MALPTSLTGPIDVLLIDNFDSFTWNLYQQLCLLGANVTVIRNDAIPPSSLAKLHIKCLIISPGPGHPKSDSGISRDAIRHFTGKVPVLGVCMGLECLVDIGGGEIGYVVDSFIYRRFVKTGSLRKKVRWGDYAWQVKQNTT